MAADVGATHSDPVQSNAQVNTGQTNVGAQVTSDFDKNRTTPPGGAVSLPQNLQNGQTNVLAGAVNGTAVGDGFSNVGALKSGAPVTLAAWQGGNQPTPISPDQPFDKELVREHPSFEAARNQALAEVGDLGPNARPVYGRLGDAAGQFVGMQSADGKKGFRLDYAPQDPNDPAKPFGPHFNWWDRTEGTKRGQGARQGAEYFPGGQEEFQRRLQENQRFDPAIRQQQQQQQQEQQQQVQQQDTSFRDRIAAITGLTGAALTAYLIVSEGSRLFPPRNLVPIP